MQNKRIAFLFPGQGVQYIGMGQEFYQQFGVAKEIFSRADEVLGYSISRLCFQGPQEELALTQYCQLAILTTSIACLQVVLETTPLEPVYVAGHSLGEYSALVASESLEFQTALELVQKRAQFMHRQAAQTPGGMAAILGLSGQQIASICQQTEQETGQILQPANFNCPGQLVISGQEGSLDKGCQLAMANGAKRAIRLAVSGGFHSKLMVPAGENLKRVLEKTEVKTPKIPVIANAEARPISDPVLIKESLIKQISNPVLWQQSIEWMIEQGVSTFVEIGPGKVLSGLVKRINEQAQIKNIEDIKSLERVNQELCEMN